MTGKKTPFEEVHRIRLRILADAKIKLSAKLDRDYLESQDAFCSPASFWRFALSCKLCTWKEYKLAEQYYGNMWTYAGD